MSSSFKKKRERDYRAKIHDIFVCSKNELAPFATVFSFSGENFEQQKLGMFFGIIKVDDRSEDSSYIVNLLTSVMKKEYFGKPFRASGESFEASLRKANLALAELVRHGATSWAGKINFVGGAVEKNNLHFSRLGNVSIFLIRGGEIAEISAELEEEKGEESHPLKTFSNISSGKLEKGDKLIFTTHDLNDVFSQEELRQNATHFSREEFPGFLELSLRANSELSGTIVLDITEKSELKPMIVQTDLVAGKETIKKIDSFVGAQEIVAKEKAQPASPDPAFWKETSTSQKISGIYVFSGFLKKTRDFLSSLAHFARKIEFRKHFSGILFWAKYSLSKMKPFFSSLFFKLKNANWKDKKALLKIFAGAAAFAILSFGLVILIKNQSNQKADQETTAPLLAESASEPQSLDDINVKNVDSIEEVASFPQEKIGLAFFDNAIYVISGKDRGITRIDPQTKAMEEAKSDFPSGSFGLLTAMPHLKALFVLTEDSKVITFTPTNKKFQENSISLPANLKARDIKSYLTYLYILDVGGSQIYRYPRAEGGFGEGQNWLRNTADLKNAKGIAINGNLFLAESEKITAYLQGKIDPSVNFEKPNVPIAIEKIYSEPDMEFVWALDNKNRRVIRFSKDGKILNQYFHKDIIAMKDFSVDEKKKIVYFLQGNSIKKFTFE